MGLALIDELLGCGTYAEDFLDALVGDLFLAVDAFGVDAEEDFDAVSGAFGDLGGGDAAVEPQGDGGVAQVVTSASDRNAVVAAFSAVNSCGPDLSREVKLFQQAAASRQHFVSELSSVPGVFALPAQMIQDLSAAWQVSGQADQDYAAWANDESVSGGCTPDDSANARRRPWPMRRRQRTSRGSSACGILLRPDTGSPCTSGISYDAHGRTAVK